MLIVDAQVHIWAADTAQHPWPAGRNAPHRPVPFTKEDAVSAMDSAGVHRAVLVTPSWQGECNDVTLEAARLNPDRFRVMGRLDIDTPQARGQIRTWLQQPGMIGLRFTFTIKGAATDDWVWAEAEAAGIPIMESTPQLALIARAAARHPQLKFVLDPPMAKGRKDSEAFADLDQLLALAKYPNIAVKAKALPNYASDGYPFRALHPAIRRIYDAYGPQRMFWGTDLTGLKCSYGDAVTMFTEEIPWLTRQDKEWIMGRGVCEWIGWDITHPSPSRP